MGKVGGHCDLNSSQNHLVFTPWLEGPKRCYGVKYEWPIFHAYKTCHLCSLAENLSKWPLWPWKWGQGQMVGMWQKVLPRMIIHHKQIGQYGYSHWNITSISLHWNTCKTWTMAHKSEVKGHGDLLLWLQRDIDPKDIFVQLEPIGLINATSTHQCTLKCIDFNGKSLRSLWPQFKSESPRFWHG